MEKQKDLNFAQPLKKETKLNQIYQENNFSFSFNNTIIKKEKGLFLLSETKNIEFEITNTNKTVISVKSEQSKIHELSQNIKYLEEQNNTLKIECNKLLETIASLNLISSKQAFPKEITYSEKLK